MQDWPVPWLAAFRRSIVTPIIMKFNELTISQKCGLALIPAAILMFLKLNAMESWKFPHTVFAALYFPIISMIGAWFVTMIGFVAISRGDIEKQTDSIMMASVGVTYLFVLYASSGYWFAEDKANRWCEMLESAEQQLIENGERLTVQNLKKAARERYMETDDKPFDDDPYP